MRGYQNITRFLRNESGQALTEYVIITFFVTIMCLYLIDPNNTLFRNIRKFHDAIAIMLYLPGP